MWFLIIMFLVFKPFVGGDFIEDNIRKSCCDQGKKIARSNSVQECSLLSPSRDAILNYGSHCLNAMTLCCTEFHNDKKQDQNMPIMNVPSNLNLQVFLNIINNGNNNNSLQLTGSTAICPVGYALQKNQCEDVDECALSGSKFLCSQNAECINTVGSYQCRCHEGYQHAPSSNTACVQIETCASDKSCQHICSDVQSGIQCSCYRGYRLNPDKRTCLLVDECVENKDAVCQYQCQSYPGGYRCFCPAGYTLADDGKSCVDINECLTDAAHCDEGAKSFCFNTIGSYMCVNATCPPNFYLDSTAYTNEDLGWHGCARNHCADNDVECYKQPKYIWNEYINIPSNMCMLSGKSYKVLLTYYNVGNNNKWSIQTTLEPSSVKEFQPDDVLFKKHDDWLRVYLARPIEGPQRINYAVTVRESSTVIDKICNIHLIVSEHSFV